MSGTPVLVVMLDTVPDYIQKTFALNEDGRYTGNTTVQTIREGDVIPVDVEFAVILFNPDPYHFSEVMQVARQIEAMSPGAHVMWLPVQG